MRAVQILGDKENPRVTISDKLPKPDVTGAELLVKVHAAGITGDELSWPEVYTTDSRIPGHDISGVIAAVGPDYKGLLHAGDAVFVLVHVERGCGQADYVVCSADEVASKPASISHAQAAALPIPALTAWEAMVDQAHIKPNSKILVTGASGAVGTIFVQLAHTLFNADVTALASSRNHEQLHLLGATTVLDYNAPDWETRVADIDIVFDTVGGDVLAKAEQTVADRASVVTVADPPPPWATDKALLPKRADGKHVEHRYFIVGTNSERLAQVARMLDAGQLQPLPVETFPFARAVEAWARARQRGRGGSKVVIEF